MANRHAGAVRAAGQAWERQSIRVLASVRRALRAAGLMLSIFAHIYILPNKCACGKLSGDNAKPPARRPYHSSVGGTIMDRIFIACLSFLAGSVLVSFAAADKDECLAGPKISDPIQFVNQRVVACFNYSNKVEVENYNKLVELINAHEKRIHELERKTAPLVVGTTPAAPAEAPAATPAQ